MAVTIKCKNCGGTYGNDAYNCSPTGDGIIHCADKAAKTKLMNVIEATAGTFTGAVISQIYVG